MAVSSRSDHAPAPLSSAGPGAGRRVGMADVARHLGVSVMTVSYALRHHPKIPVATREKVKRAAHELGYTPSPEIGRLMHLLRGSAPSEQHRTVGILTFVRRSAPTRPFYHEELVAGLRQRAARLGYAVDEVAVDTDRLGEKRLGAILESRGIRGVILPPLPVPMDCRPLLDWSRFAVVAANYSAQGISVDRVVPHHFANCRQLFQRLLSAGHRTIGVAVRREFDVRFDDCHRAVYARLRERDAFPPIPWLVDPTPERTERWLRRHRPDVVVTHSTLLPALRAAGARHLAVLDLTPGDGVPGIDQLPREIGRSALELLAGKITRGEFGPPRHPQVTLLEGLWREARDPAFAAHDRESLHPDADRTATVSHQPHRPHLPV